MKFTDEEYARQRQANEMHDLLSRLEEANGYIDKLEGLLREVYSQAGNGAPAERRHALTPGLRDDIRDVLYPR